MYSSVIHRCAAVTCSGALIVLNSNSLGQERFHALGPIYYRGSHGAILVYDITDEESFLKVKSWVRELQKMLGNEIKLAIAGNKSDLIKDRTVPMETAQEYATQVGAKYFETSAKLNEGVDELFLGLTSEMIAVNNTKNSIQRNSSTRRTNALRVEETENEDGEGEERRPANRCCSS